MTTPSRLDNMRVVNTGGSTTEIATLTVAFLLATATAFRVTLTADEILGGAV